MAELENQDENVPTIKNTVQFESFLPAGVGAADEATPPLEPNEDVGISIEVGPAYTQGILALFPDMERREVETIPPLSPIQPLQGLQPDETPEIKAPAPQGPQQAAQADPIPEAGEEEEEIPQEQDARLAVDLLSQQVDTLRGELVRARIQNIQLMADMEARMRELVGTTAAETVDVAVEQATISTVPSFDDQPSTRMPGLPPNFETLPTGTAREFKVRGGTWFYQDGSGAGTVADVSPAAGSGWEDYTTVTAAGVSAGWVYAILNLTGAATLTFEFRDVLPTWSADIYYMRLADVSTAGVLSNVRKGNIGPMILTGGGWYAGVDDASPTVPFGEYVSADGQVGFNSGTGITVAVTPEIDGAFNPYTRVQITNKHVPGSILPEDVGSAASAGTSDDVARIDHVHRAPHWNQMQSATADTDILPDTDEAHDLRIGVEELGTTKAWNNVEVAAAVSALFGIHDPLTLGAFLPYIKLNASSESILRVATTGFVVEGPKFKFRANTGTMALFAEDLPTTAPAGANQLYTQTTDDLFGDSGTTKLICITDP